MHIKQDPEGETADQLMHEQQDQGEEAEERLPGLNCYPEDLLLPCASIPKLRCASSRTHSGHDILRTRLSLRNRAFSQEI